MRISCVAFTERGMMRILEVRRVLETAHQVRLYAKTRSLPPDNGICPIEVPMQQWAKERFADSDALIFVGACGIAVRAVAPHVRDKRTDPAVVVMDEMADYCIPILSGHIGGANELAAQLAAGLSCVPVYTTATDVNHRFAVDVFASRHRLHISSMRLAKEVSAALLRGETLGIASDFPVEGRLPEGFVRVSPEEKSDLPLGIYFSVSRRLQPFAETLYLVPRIVTAGIGCRKGAQKEKIEAVLQMQLEKSATFPEALLGLASIDLKKDEPGILQLAGELSLPFHTFSAEELNAVPGSFTPSEFVKKTTGADNVCERSAVRAGGGTVYQKKTGADGATCALAVSDWSVRFE